MARPPRGGAIDVARMSREECPTVDLERGTGQGNGRAGFLSGTIGDPASKGVGDESEIYTILLQW
jgi:hypothetical protein